MLGKNRGRPRRSKLIQTAAPCTPIGSNENEDDQPSVMIRLSSSKVPSKVGSELTFTQFATAVEPALLHDLLRCKSALLTALTHIFLTIVP